MATPLRQSTDTLATQFLSIPELPQPVLQRLFELLDHDACRTLTILCKQHVGILSALCKKHFEVLSADPSWKDIYIQRFQKNPIPLGLTYFQAAGPKWRRVSDFFNYSVRTPLGILYKKAALGGIKLKEFELLPENAQNALNLFEADLPRDPAAKCAAIAAHVNWTMSKLPTPRQSLVYWHLSRLFYQYPRKRMKLQGVLPSKIEFFGRRNVLFNPLRLIDAVEIISNSSLLLKATDNRMMWKFSSFLADILAERMKTPVQIPSVENYLEDFGTKEAFPFCNLEAIGEMDNLSSSDNEGVNAEESLPANDSEDLDAEESLSFSDNEDLDTEESLSSSDSSSYCDTIATISFEETS